MPTYEFTCRQCESHFEVFISISNKSEIVCPSCGGRDMKEVFGCFFVGGTPSKGSGGSCSGNCADCSSKCG